MKATHFRGLGAALLLAALASACVPTGSAPAYDAGANNAPTASYKPSFNVMTGPFEDNFDNVDAQAGQAESWPVFDAGKTDAATYPIEGGAGVVALLLPDAGSVATAEGGAASPDAGEARAALQVTSLGPNWLPARTNAWKYENGKLCGQGAHNHPVWLNRTLPVNARIEFDAIAYSDDGDLKVEVWGDGRSFATGTSYTNATSYIAVLGGWKNTIHAIARINEHGADRKEIKVDKDSDDPRERGVVRGQTYHFRIERTDGKTVRWSVDGLEYLSFADTNPLAGQGHDHIGFNEWEAKVCFDNVKVTPL